MPRRWVCTRKSVIYVILENSVKIKIFFGKESQISQKYHHFRSRKLRSGSTDRTVVFSSNITEPNWLASTQMADVLISQITIWWRCGYVVYKWQPDNYQTPDKPMQLNTAKFRQNGRSGYVLRSDLMFDQNFNPYERTTLKGVKPITLTIKVRLSYRLNK